MKGFNYRGTPCIKAETFTGVAETSVTRPPKLKCTWTKTPEVAHRVDVTFDFAFDNGAASYTTDDGLLMKLKDIVVEDDDIEVVVYYTVDGTNPTINCVANSNSRQFDPNKKVACAVDTSDPKNNVKGVRFFAYAPSFSNKASEAGFHSFTDILAST